MFQTILCPVDGSDHARHALSRAIELAKRDGARLVMLHALLRHANAADLERFAEIEGLARHLTSEVNRLRAMDGRLDIGHTTYDESRASSRALVEIGQHLLDDAKRDAREGGVQDVETVLADDDAARAILRCVEEKDVDCVVMGSRGLGSVAARFLGSVSHKVVNHAPCTCITVR